MRLVTPGDYPAIEGALRKLEDYAKAYNWAVGVDFQHAYTNVVNACENLDGYIIDGYLVLVDVVNPWFTKDRYLQEWLVIKVYGGGKVDAIPPALEALAYLRGCKAIITADSSPVNIVAKAYEAAGFSPLTTSFYKVLSNGIHSQHSGKGNGC